MTAVRLWKKRDEEKGVWEFIYLFLIAYIYFWKLFCERKVFVAGKLTVFFDDTQVLLQKVAQLEEALTQKDKFIHSSRMIVKFREDHISRLEKKLKEGQDFMSKNESQTVIDQMKEEIKILRDQVQNLRTI